MTWDLSCKLRCAPYSKRLVLDSKLYLSRYFFKFYSSHSFIIFSRLQLFILHLFLYFYITGRMSTDILELTNIPVSLAIVDKNLARRLKNKLHAQDWKGWTSLHVHCAFKTLWRVICVGLSGQRIVRLRYCRIIATNRAGLMRCGVQLFTVKPSVLLC